MTDKQKKVLYRIIATALLYAVLLCNGTHRKACLYGTVVCDTGIIFDSVFCNRLGHYVQSREKYITRTGI